MLSIKVAGQLLIKVPVSCSVDPMAHLRHAALPCLISWAEYGRDFRTFFSRTLQILTDARRSDRGPTKGSADSDDKGSLTPTRHCVRKLAIESSISASLLLMYP